MSYKNTINPGAQEIGNFAKSKTEATSDAKSRQNKSWGILEGITTPEKIRSKNPTGKLHRLVFFDKTVFHRNWKKAMIGENESPVVEILNHWGYRENTDYVRQFPIGDLYVTDFAFVPEKLIIEVDGANHKNQKQQRADEERDRFFWRRKWVVLRITDEQLKKSQSFYKYLIREIVDDRRRLWVTPEML